MPENNPPTQRQQIDSIIALTGAPAGDFAAAQSTIESWRTGAQTVDQANAREREIFALFGEGIDSHAALLSSIHQSRSAMASLFGALGATDFAGANAAVASLLTDRNSLQGFQTGLANMRTILKLPETASVDQIAAAVTDFEGRVNAEVINRAAAAGITAPIPKPRVKPAGDANVLTRAEWNTLSAAQQLEFSKNGGKLTD